MTRRNRPSGSGSVPGSSETTMNSGDDAAPLSDEQVDQLELNEQPGDRELVGTQSEPVAEGVAAGTAGYVVPEGQVVYRGPFGAREITRQDWERAGVAEQPTVRWDRANGFSLPKEAFTDEALRVIQQDPDLHIG